MMSSVKLAEVSEFVLDGTHGSPERTETGVPVLSALNVKDGRLAYETTRYTSDQEFKAFDRRIGLAKGDLLLTIVGTIGRAAIVDEVRPAVFQRSVAIIRPMKTKVDSRYLFHVTQSAAFANQLDRATNKSAQAGVYLGKLKETSLPLPPLEEQKRIAAILDQADELRRKRQRALDRLNQLGHAMFVEMFGDPVANPFGFLVRRLGDVGDLDRGISKHRPRNDPALLNGDHPLIQTGDVANADGYIRHFSSTYSDLGLRQSRKWPIGTLCITIAANIGKTAILDIEACFPDSVVGFTPNEATNAEYVQHWMERIQKRLEKIAPQSAQKNINLAILRELPIPIPPIEKQKTFALQAKFIEAQKVKLRAAESHLDLLFSSLQHRAFRGELL